MMALHPGRKATRPATWVDDVAGGDARTEDHDAGTGRVDGPGEGGEVRVPLDAVVELADVVGEDAADDLVGVHHTDRPPRGRVCVLGCSRASVIAQPAPSAWRG